MSSSTCGCKCCYDNGAKKCSYHGKHIYNGQSYCGKHLQVIKSQEECSICLNPMTVKAQRVKLSCGHYFHIKCLEQCQKAECPMCRSTFTIGEAYTIYERTVVKPIVNRIFKMPKDVHGALFNNIRFCIELCEKGDWYVSLICQLFMLINKHGNSPQRIVDAMFLMQDMLENTV